MSFMLPQSISEGELSALRKSVIAGGFDQNPVPTQVHVANNCLIVHREVDESGYLAVPWPVAQYGEIVTTTASLRERPEPYYLLLELARGKLNQVRCQTFEWQMLGLRLSAEYEKHLNSVNRLFCEAVTSSSFQEVNDKSKQVLIEAYHLADILVKMYFTQVLDTRHAEEGKLKTALGADVTKPFTRQGLVTFRKSFNALRIPFRWCDIEPNESQYDWSSTDALLASVKDSNLLTYGGPIIDLAAGLVPDWAAGWDGDLPTLAAFMSDYVESVLQRYRNRIRRWQICAGFNHAHAYGLTDDDRLRLAAKLFEAATNVDSQLQLTLRITQPWGDYLAQEEETIPPLQFADDLLRSGLPISAIDLEIVMGSSPRGSWKRDLLETCRVIDLFGLLGLPIEVTLSLPSSDEMDAFAARHGQIALSGSGYEPTPLRQAEWGAAFAALALCKPHVRWVTWSHWSDADPHLFPAGGILSSSDQPKPLLAKLAALRNEHLA